MTFTMRRATIRDLSAVHGLFEHAAEWPHDQSRHPSPARLSGERIEQAMGADLGLDRDDRRRPEQSARHGDSDDDRRRRSLDCS